MSRQLETLGRLRLMYLLLGIMLFYGIEQLFLNKYIHSLSARGFITITYTASLVMFDVPTGIIADRVGRKICLVGACLAQIAALLVLGFSNSLFMYAVGSVLFGLYISLFNGASQAFLYDWLADRGETANYARLQGGMYAYWLAGAGVANLLSGFIAHYLGLRYDYIISILPGLVTLWLLRPLRDPPLERKQTLVWYSHVGEALRELRSHRALISYSLQFVAATIVLLTVGEFGQIYLLSFGISTIVLGIYWAITAATASFGRAMAHRLQRIPRLTVLVFCVILVLFALTRGRLGIGLFWLVYGLNEALANVTETEIQDSTSSHIRATMLSLVSFTGNAIAIPVILLYSTCYRRHGIVAANRVLILAIVVLMIGTLLISSKRRKRVPRPLTTTSISNQIG